MKDIAITTYIDNSENGQIEFSWLYNSWIYSKSYEVSDIIAFYNPKIENLKEYPEVTFIPLVPLSESDETWTNYKFINSIYFLTTAEGSELTKHKYILRTDCDVFLTPNFKNLRPRLATFGIGLYANEASVCEKLVKIAEKWRITPVFNNIGSTFIAQSDLALQYNQIQLEYCKKLNQDEFKDGHGTWPGWFHGVLTMYAGQLAANAVFETGIMLGGLDVLCMAQTEMCNTDYHIHAWHTHDYFSKFRWFKGEYADFEINKLNKNCIADYCLFIAGNKP